jgi:hypothetical protein
MMLLDGMAWHDKKTPPAKFKQLCKIKHPASAAVSSYMVQVLSMALALERGLPEEFFPPPARPMDRLKQLLGGGGYQGTLSESGPTLSSTPPPPAQTTTANAVAPEASETGASGCSSPASSPVEGPARSPSDDFLLHHAAILLRCERLSPGRQPLLKQEL